jgi:hypothetical protein
MRTQSAPYHDNVVTRARTANAIPPMLFALLGEFHQQKISYCYWKSSRRVCAVLAGEGDVDLVVAREDQHRVEAILLVQGFKRFPSVADRDDPAILSFLGYDEPSDQLIHVHLHFRLILGERLLKNYRVPWEDVLLARAILHPTLPIRLLDPTSEAVLLVVRACLELRRTDPVTLRSWRATTQKFALDREELAARVDRTILFNRAAEFLSDDLAEMIADAIYSQQPLESHRCLRRRIQRYFTPYRSYNSFEARVRGVMRALIWAIGNLNKRFLHVPRPWNRRAPGGGRIVAIVGLDGSGKTTMAAAMRAWLGSVIDVVPIYFGTGDGRPSLLLRPLKLLVPLIMRALRTRPEGASRGKMSNRDAGLLYSVLLMVWATVVAVEKRMKLAAARRGANRGLVVIADRYPQNEILSFNDGPLLARLSRAPPWIRRFEAPAYTLAHRLPPDLVIKLQVLPETVARREPEMDPTIIWERITALQRLEFPGARVVCVDAEQPLPDVIRVVKQEIWRLL